LYIMSATESTFDAWNTSFDTPLPPEEVQYLNRFHEPPIVHRGFIPPLYTPTIEPANYCYADIVEEAIADVTRGIQEVPADETISVEAILFLTAVKDLRSHLSYVYSKMQEGLLNPLSPSTDYIGIAKALLAEHKAFVDGLVKQESLKEQTNQLLSGVSSPPSKVDDSQP